MHEHEKIERRKKQEMMKKHQQCWSSTMCNTKNLHSELCSRTLLAQLGPVYVLLYFYIKKNIGSEKCNTMCWMGGGSIA